MSEAAKRAAARRKAILSSKTDRLAKLTSTARGEDAVNIYADPPVPLAGRNLAQFVGEELPADSMPKSQSDFVPRMPFNPPLRPRPSTPPLPDPSVWGERQDHLLHALMNGQQQPGSTPLPAGTTPANDPFMNFLASMANPQNATTGSPLPGLLPPGLMPPGAARTPPTHPIFDGAPLLDPFSSASSAQSTMFESQRPPTPKSLLTKLIPLIHLLSTVVFFVFFVFWYEPWKRGVLGEDASVSRWQRWADLAISRPNANDSWSIQPLPMLWSFVTLQLILHSWRIFAQTDPPSPPFLLQLALPYLPPPLPAIITNALKYIQMIGMIFDDLSVLIVGLGTVVWCASWFVAIDR